MIIALCFNKKLYVFLYISKEEKMKTYLLSSMTSS